MTDLLLKVSEKKEIIEVLKQFPEVESAVIFGSRAKGTAKKASDVDIALSGKDLDQHIISRVHDLLEEETSLPYFFDVLDKEKITNEELRDHIERVGVKVYPCSDKSSVD